MYDKTFYDRFNAMAGTFFILTKKVRIGVPQKFVLNRRADYFLRRLGYHFNKTIKEQL